MKSKEVYEIWKTGKRQIEITNGFSDKVIDRIREYEKQRTQYFFAVHRLIEAAFSNPLAKAGMIATGAIVGILRIVFLLYAILWC